MARADIPVDLFNPGQVFACLGFVEAAEVLIGEVRGGFHWHADQDSVRFRIEAKGENDPFRRVLEFLKEASAVAIKPRGYIFDNEDRWGGTGKGKIQIKEQCSGVFPVRPPDKIDRLPVRLEDKKDQGHNRKGRSIVIDHWADDKHGSDMKFWGGRGGMPGSLIVQKELDSLRIMKDENMRDPFEFCVRQLSSLRFDFRNDFVTLDDGFTPNEHKNMMTKGYPVVEILAAIGITYTRPVEYMPRHYHYGVAGLAGDELYESFLLRAALSSSAPLFPGMPFRVFSMRLGKTGKDTCITNITEESPQS